MITYSMMGRLIRDAETVTNKKGESAEKFTLSVPYEKDRTRLYTCYYYGERAMKLHSYLLKGRQVVVVGSPSWSEYNGKEYENVRVNTFEFCGTRTDAEKQQENPDHLPYQCGDRYFSTRQELENYKASLNTSSAKTNGPEEWDDADIPF